MPDIRDITDPGSFIPEPVTPWWMWLIVALGLILLIGAIYWIYKARTSKAFQQKPSIDKARDEIQKLRDNADDMEPHTAATELSLIVRRYLAGAFSDPALFETNEEFTLRQSALPSLHTESRELVTQHLSKLSQLKYSPVTESNISENITEHIDQANELLSHIESHLNQPVKSS
ncbi:DUF4381 domain-containing protein [Akkermansiaceae bacterium]|nr:DUF4381 domain-containing protein [Akkermansiaceae bacterium]